MIKNIKHICFDLDKTLTKENIWLNLNLAMGMTRQEDKNFFDLYQQRKLTYMDWQKALEKIYIQSGKATKENIMNIISNYTYNPGAIEVIKYLKTKGYTISLISGSIDLLVKRVADELGIKKYSAHNTFEFDTDGSLQKIICNGDDSDFKLSKLKEFCKQENINITNVVCIGDGANDLKIFIASQHGITFKGSQIKQYSWKTINTLKDLELLL